MGAAVMSRVLGVDPGDVRIGVAISDETQTIARPLTVLAHRSRRRDAAAILEIAREHSAGKIVLGVAYDLDGKTGPQARKALRLANALRDAGAEAVDIWDESGSTSQAMQLSETSHDLDARAAAVILQDYLDAKMD
jgi:putative Holliday junction resolvase